jgi:uncharacterized protein YdaU (DUF1376 family)
VRKDTPKPPWFPWYCRDWLGSPTRRYLESPRARLAYLELLFYCWDGEAKLPADPKELRKLAECSEQEWDEFGTKILEKFVPYGEGVITNKKVLGLWKGRKAFQKSKKEAGRKGAAKRWHKDGTAIGLPLAKNAYSHSSAFAFAFASAKEKQNVGMREGISGSDFSFSPEVQGLCEFLRVALKMESVPASWYPPAEEILKDGNPEQLQAVIEFAMSTPFWSTRLTGMVKLHKFLNSESEDSLMNKYLAAERKKALGSKPERKEVKSEWA